jgi:uncharacterized protein (TIGR03083 family)
LEALRPDAWSTPSLCEGWTVQAVAAHLAWAPAMGPREQVVELSRSRFRVGRYLRDSAVRWAERGVPAILEQLRSNVETGARPTGVPPMAALVDAVVHALDIRRPLGDHRSLPAAAFGPTADFCAGARWPSTGMLGGSAARRIRGLRLVAEDQEWATGSGAEVHGSGEALLLVLTHRPVGPDELSGPGAPTLMARL